MTAPGQSLPHPPDKQGPVIRWNEEELQENQKNFETKFCHFFGKPCIAEKCWNYKGGIQLKPEERVMTTHDGREYYAYTGKVLVNFVHQCKAEEFPRLITQEEEADPGFKFDEKTENILGPDGERI